MADLSAVLRKTIDALPAATPQLRAKVYEKARTAIQRQIAAANPPLGPEMVDARQRALEDAIAATEAHYTASPAGDADAPVTPGGPAPAAPTYQSPPPPRVPPEAPRVSAEPPRPVAPPPVSAPPPAAPPVPRRPEPVEQPAASRAEPPMAPQRPVVPQRPPEGFALRPARDAAPGRVEPQGPSVASHDGSSASDARVGEIGPMSELPTAAAAAPAAFPAGGARGDQPPSSQLDDIPRADMQAPSYARPRARRSNNSLVTGLAALLFVGALGAVGYYYSDEISGAISGDPQVATSEGTAEPAAGEGEEVAAVEPGATEVPPEDEATTPAAADPGSREFTQRLLPDGTEVDEGPAEAVPNAFDEGTDVAAASPVLSEDQPVSASEGQETETAAVAPDTDPSAVPVGQRAVFYEERSDTRPGSQNGGDVVWSVVNEPPAAGEPAEPAIRAVADIEGTELQMTMTIRRNADDTLPASHVIEILFDTPEDFGGGEIENVQRLALKPTEQARGEPLIGVAGKISEGFFIIALNDLQQAVDNNLALMADQDWIDIPLAYSSGQRALISLEKGIPGDRVFQEAMDAWAART